MWIDVEEGTTYFYWLRTVEAQIGAPTASAAGSTHLPDEDGDGILYALERHLGTNPAIHDDLHRLIALERTGGQWGVIYERAKSGNRDDFVLQWSENAAQWQSLWTYQDPVETETSFIEKAILEGASADRLLLRFLDMR